MASVSLLPEEKPAMVLSRSESGAKSLSETTLDPSDPSHRNYLIKIRAELSPQKSPAVSYMVSRVNVLVVWE